MVTQEAFLRSSEPAEATSSRPTVRSAPSASRVRASKALFLFAAGVSFLLSVSLWFLVDREQGLFVGLWVPSILALGSLVLPREGGER